ncbi:amidohydrolase family protein [uncultured Dokdonia sp.]|uniref:amidohydrolase family protein n=1 Tax=uncultured Dokdonia sp. TaxID=575653 RepID=UPI002610C4E7|nr:amidohydrolase family protein [uncultured Dokdonia sp.]
MKTLYALLVTCILCISCAQPQKSVSPTATVITDITIIDVVSGKELPSQHVVIDSGKIKKITAQMEDLTSYSTIIDGKGKYLIPGLAEMHAHIPPPSSSAAHIEETLFLYLSNGITTIRGMLGHSEHLRLRERAASGDLLSPRIYTASPSLNGNSVKTKEEAIAKVTAYQKEGFDFLKIHPGIQREVFDQVVATANEVGIPFAGHVPVAVGVRHAIESNYAAIDHVDGFLEGLVPESANVKPEDNGFFGYNFTPLADVTKINELVTLSRKHTIWIVPTQSLYERWFAPITASELLKDPEMKYMPASTLANWKARKGQYTTDNPDFNEPQWQQFNDIRKQLIKALQDDGHGILLGSDAPQLFNVPGFSIHHEIDGMTKAGLTPLQILQSGTINPAKFFSAEDEYGAIKEDLSADLVLLDNNPLEDAKYLKNVAGIFVKGHWLSREAIAKRLSEIAKVRAGK